MRTMRDDRRPSAATHETLPRWRFLAGAVIYLGATLRLCRLFF